VTEEEECGDEGEEKCDGDGREKCDGDRKESVIPAKAGIQTKIIMQ